MIGPRRRAREIALQILIQMDFSPELATGAALRLYFDHLAADADPDADPDDPFDPVPSRGVPFDRVLVNELVEGVADRRAEIDAIVQDLSRKWRIERMASVDRNVIRLALFELKYSGDKTAPTNVVLNEAIELAKRFGSTEGGAFVNGLLDRAVNELHLRR
jgi:transcription antitermination protein NusB